MKDTKRKIVVGVFISILVAFVIYSFAPVKDTVDETFTFHTLDAGKIVANVSVDYKATPRMIYKSKKNSEYFRDVMKRNVRKVLYENFYEDILYKNYTETRDKIDDLSIKIITLATHIQYEQREPLDFDNAEEIDIRDIDPPSSCFFNVKSATCEIVLDSMIEAQIEKVWKAQEDVAIKARELKEKQEQLLSLEEKKEIEEALQRQMETNEYHRRIRSQEN